MASARAKKDGRSASWIQNGYIEAVCACAAVALNAALTVFVFTAASAQNYPGGHALSRMHGALGCPYGVRGVAGGAVTVHVGNLAAINGVTRFGEMNECYAYSKREGLSEAADYDGFDVLLSEEPQPPSSEFVPVLVQDGLAGVGLRGVRTEPKIYVYARPDVIDAARARNG